MPASAGAASQPSASRPVCLEVFSGPCSSLTSIGCNDDGGGVCGLGSSLTVNLTNGATYLIRIGGFNGAFGTFELDVEPGTGGGSLTTLNHHCGPVTIAVTGDPRIGGTLTATIGGFGSGLPFVGIGFMAPSPFCGACTIGHTWTAAVFGSTVSTTVPCSAAFIGLPLGFQGAGFLTPGGCGTPQISLSDTVQAIIG